MKCIITIELGTNAVRIVAFDLNGTIIGNMKGHYPTFHPQPDYSEQDPEQLFITMLYVLKNLLNEKIYPQHYRVATICFSSSMHSLLAVDKNGTPLGNALTWSDSRAKKEMQDLKISGKANDIYAATGMPLHPMSPMLKIAWMNNNDKERFAKTAKFLSIKSYIIHQLTGNYLLDYSLAGSTGMLNIDTVKWESDALAFAGIKQVDLPDLVPVFSEAGNIKKAYQNSLGLDDNTKILVGSSDGCLAALGSGIWNNDAATITIEDSGAVRVMGGQKLYDEKKRVFNYLLTETCYVSGGPTNNGGLIFEWYAKQFGDFARAYDIERCMEDLYTEAAKVQPGSNGLLFLPYLLGERAPIWNADARGMYFGINIKHEKKHFIRATIEGIMYEIFSIGKMLNAHKNISTLSINGSFATIPFCTQMIADVFNKPVHIAQNTNGVSTGAFLLAATEMKIFKDLKEAASTITLAPNFLPSENNNNTYMKCFNIFESLSSKLDNEFSLLAKLQ